MKVKDLFLDNLLLPVTSLLLVIVVSVLNKNSKLVKLPQLIILVIASSLLIGLTGFVILIDIPFLPYLHLYISILYIVLGYIYMNFATDIFINNNNIINQTGIIAISISILFSGSYIFSIVFNSQHELQYGLLASTCTYSFVIPTLFNWTYKAMLDIPPSIMKVWKYDIHFRDVEFNSESVEKLMILELEFSKSPDDSEMIKVKAKAPAHLEFGTWFQMFINDYNSKYFETCIEVKTPNNELYDWIFYVKKYNFIDQIHINPSVSIEQNGIKESNLIICKRVGKYY